MEVEENTLNYRRIARAIAYIRDNFTQQPSLDEIAAHIHLSPFHFQRLFQDWVGTTPKKFLQYISLSHAKEVLTQNNSILSTSHSIGLSSSSRLHELFVNIEAMTPAEYKNEGKSLTIHYSIQDSPFGKIVIASTTKGICQISFLEEDEEYLSILNTQFPKATFIPKEEEMHKAVLNTFNLSSTQEKPIHIHLKGSDFQLKVWEALLKIPVGNLLSYGAIAKSIDQPNASRAVGTAIGSNPLAYLIPCHRVIQASGIMGGYRWNPIRKTAIIGWEAIQTNRAQNETI